MAPTHAPLTRASLDSSKYSSVNVFLKSIKLHTRTLSALFAQHATELAVLERIYYLNNNQHRPALFWQRVVEARRYSRRLKSLDVPSLVDGLRRTFHGDVADASSKSHKGAWTHYPSASSLKSFLGRTRTCTTLLDKTCVRMRAIYHMLTLAMQSAHLSSAVRGALSTLHSECAHLLSRLHPAEASHNLAPLLPPPSPVEGNDSKVSRASLESNRRTVPDSDLDASVDLGEAVTRTPPALMPGPKIRSASHVLPDYLAPVHDTTRTPALAVETRQSAAAAASHAPPPLALKPSSRLVAVVKNESRMRPPSNSHTTASEQRKEKRSNKAKKPRRDEIDDIFA